MTWARIFLLVASLAAAGISTVTAADRPANPGFTIEAAVGFPIVESLTAAHSGTRIVWVLEEKGVRNLWGAEAPAWQPHQITHFFADDGKAITRIGLSSNGNQIVFVRNDDEGNWLPPTRMHANPVGLPVAQETEVWLTSFAGRDEHRLASGTSPAITADGKRVAFIKDDQVQVADTSKKTEPQPFLVTRGKVRELAWSPEGLRLAVAVDRGAHGLVGVYGGDGQPIRWMAPSSNRVLGICWSPDGTRIAFVKVAGATGQSRTRLERHPDPFDLWVADAATGTGYPAWKSPRTVAGSYPDTQGETNIAWAGNDRLVFTAHLDGWPHLYSVPASGGTELLLTPGEYMVEYVSMSPDGRFIVYNANTGKTAGDDDRRHVYRVGADRADPTPVTSGVGIEWSPVVAGDSDAIAFVSATAQRSPAVAVASGKGGAPRLLGADRVPEYFASKAFVVPQRVVFHAADGLAVHGQLFLPPGGSAKHAAVIFVHGGPARQMLLGFHYMGYYAHDYAINQYLASRGFIVLSVNYRLGIGYGDAFNNPPDAGIAGAAEYQDVLAAAQFLRARADVDHKRLGIWGGSYGGYLTALALARNSDLFAAGVDIHGVHDWIRQAELGGDFRSAVSAVYERAPDYDRALDIAWRASPDADLARWRSPVLLIHGDDDLNVDISQSVDLAERLRAQGVRFEEILIPDERHDWLLHRSVERVARATTDFLERELGGGEPR